MGLKIQGKKKGQNVKNKKIMNVDFPKMVRFQDGGEEMAHKKLLSSIKELDTKKERIRLRSEPSLDPSEFSLTKNIKLKNSKDYKSDAFDNMNEIGKHKVHENLRDSDKSQHDHGIGIDELFASFYQPTPLDPMSDHDPAQGIGGPRKTVVPPELRKGVRTLARRFGTGIEELVEDRIDMVLSPPAARPVQERAEMAAGYETVVKDVVDRWEDLVRANRTSECARFPLRTPDITIVKGVGAKTDFRNKSENLMKTDYEAEMDACLGVSENNLVPGQEFTEAEEKFLKAMSLEEATARRQELSKFKALVSYKQQKARYQNKIKSKKYRRILRKERAKKEALEIENLKANDKTVYAQRLDKLEDQRIQERMSLRHKNTGKWARGMLTQAKKDPAAKAALQEQFRLGKELTKKALADSQINDAEEDYPEVDGDTVIQGRKVESLPGACAVFDRSKEDSNALALAYQNITSDDNPWTHVTKVHKRSEAIDDFKKREIVDHASTEEDDDGESHAANIDNQTIKPDLVCDLPLIDEGCGKEFGAEGDPVPEIEKSYGRTKKDVSKEISVPERTQDSVPHLPTFMDLKPKKLGLVKSRNPNGPSKMTIAQAFADDDVIRQFSVTKHDLLRAQKDELLALAGGEDTLPGWGEWAGAGVRPERKKGRKKREERVKALKSEIDIAQKSRRDRNLKFVVLNEEKDKKISALQVSQIPYPYTNVKHFESTIRNPIGSLWNPQSVVRELTRPKIITKLGNIIKPINSSHLLSSRKRKKP